MLVLYENQLRERDREKRKGIEEKRRGKGREDKMFGKRISIFFMVSIVLSVLYINCFNYYNILYSLCYYRF